MRTGYLMRRRKLLVAAVATPAVKQSVRANLGPGPGFRRNQLETVREVVLSAILFCVLFGFMISRVWMDLESV